MVTQYRVPKELSREITQELMDAAKTVLAKHGLVLEKSSSGYGDSYKFTVSATTVRLGKNGVNLDSAEAQEFVLSASLWDMTREQATAALGEVIYTSAKTGYCFLIGYNSRKRTAPVIVRSVRDGKTYGIAETALAKVGAVIQKTAVVEL
jgi:hypothetical protein